MSLRILIALLSFPLPAQAQQALQLDAAARGRMTLCTDGKGHYVAVAPDDRITSRLYYGDGKRFFLVPAHESGLLTGNWFLDPRRYNKQGNPEFRGIDLRFYSMVELEKEKGRCEVRCGEKITQLELVPEDSSKAMLKGARFEQSPRRFAPYGLARDSMGIYYYVDRGVRPEEEKRFRLFVGPKGNLKQIKMTNIVSDSEGDIFSTPSGSLRLILDKHEPTVWIEGEKQKQLRVVPVLDNLQIIYNELGVYVGERLGTPCDDL